MKKLIFLVFFVTAMFIGLIGQQSRNVLIYNTTSTDCGPCSCLDSIFDRVMPDHFPQTIIVEFHNIGSNPKFKSFQGDSIVPTFLHDMSKEPSCFINGMGYDVNYKDIISELTSFYNEFPNANADISIQSQQWNPETQTVNFDIHFENPGPTLNGNYWYNVILTENNIIAPHQTLNGCSTPNAGGGYKTDYVNNNVVRKMVYWSHGTRLHNGDWDTGQKFIKPCSFVVDPDSAWVPENCHMVVNLYYKSDSIYKSAVLQAVKHSVASGSGTFENNLNPITVVSPNPTTNKCNVHININGSSHYNINLYDSKGMEVKKVFNGHLNQGKYNIELLMGDLNPGIYIVVLDAGNKKYTGKILKH